MSFFGKIFRKVGRVAFSPFVLPLLVDKLRQEVHSVESSPSDELRLVTPFGVLSIGQQASMTLISEVHQGFQGVGHIQYRTSASSEFHDIESDSTFSGTSPFPYTSQQHEQELTIIPGSSGTYSLRVKIDEQGGGVHYTNEIRRKVLGMSGGMID